MPVSDVNKALAKEPKSGNFWDFQWTPKGRSAKLSREYDAYQTDKKWSRDQEAVAMQNFYNSPAEQYKRYQNSGLNPALMNAGQPVSAAPAPKADKAQAIFSDPGSIKLGILDKFMQIAQIKNLDALTGKTIQDTKQSQAATYGKQQGTRESETRTRLLEEQITNTQELRNNLKTTGLNTEKQGEILEIQRLIQNKNWEQLRDKNVRPEDPFFIRQFYDDAKAALQEGDGLKEVVGQTKTRIEELFNKMLQYIDIGIDTNMSGQNINLDNR